MENIDPHIQVNGPDGTAQRSWSGFKWLPRAVLGAVLLAILFLVSRRDYLLFHTMVELASVAVAWGVFLLIWNCRKFIQNDALIFLAIAYLCIGFLDLIHTLAYKGMGVFSDPQISNLATQLWISARAMEGLSLLAFPLLLGRRLRINSVLWTYAGVTALLLSTIFAWPLFPACYVEGVGLTLFKKLAEYAICLTLASAAILLYQRRDSFSPSVCQMLLASLLMTVVAELAFTFYIDAYDLSNLVGHYFKLFSFILVYAALIRTGLTQPHALLFRELSQKERESEESEQRWRSMAESSPDHILTFDPELNITFANRAASGGSAEDLIGTSVLASLTEDARTETEATLRRVLETGQPARYDAAFCAPDGSIIYYDAHAVPQKSGEEIVGIVLTARDITERKRSEEELHGLNQQLRASIDQMPIAYILWDDCFRVVEWNASAERVFGYSKSEMLGEYPLNYIVPEPVRPLVHEVIEKLLRGEVASYSDEGNNIRKDGTVVSCHWHNTPLKNEAGATTAVLSMVIDVTERKRIESDLELQRHYLARSQEIGSIGTWELDVAKNELYWTDENYRVFGVPLDIELTYETFLDCVHPDDRQYVDRKWKAALDQEPYDIEHRLLVDGETKWVREKAELEFDEDGICVRAVGVTQNISKHKLAEEALRESEERFRRYFELGLVGMAITSLKKGWVEFNDTLCNMFGLSRDQFAELTWTELTHPEDLEPDLAQFSRVLVGEIDGYSMEKRFVREDGSVLYTEISTNAIRKADGAVDYFVTLIHDITERMEAERRLRAAERLQAEAEKLAATGRLSARVAHEINNPLAGIKSAFHLLKAAVPEDHPEYDLLPIMDRELNRIALIVKQMYQLHSPEAGKLRGVVIDQAFQDVMTMLGPLLRQHGVTIDSSDLVSNLVIRAPEGSLRQIFYNLIANAVEASPDGEVVSVRAHLGDNLESVVIECHDQGAGIAADMQDQIFQPFFTSKVYADSAEGMGLGLSVVKSIVEAIGGTIDFESTLDLGTVFRVVLPLSQKEGKS